MKNELSGNTTLVVGASRGLGRGIARAFADAGASVVAVARTGSALAELAATSANIRAEIADAADATATASLLDQYDPDVLILVAGATPMMRPLQYQTWETFSVNWHADVKIAQGYAARSGQTEDVYVKELGALWTPEQAGAAIVKLVQTDAAQTTPEYMLTAGGLQKLP
jgi:NAD(P)-dependent dehydrogenase (short-subunit alcohol dehydrogenase family)